MLRGLQTLLVVVGAVMVVAGSSTVIGGADLIPGVETVTPSVDSEMRFYAVWYVVGGLFLLRAVPRIGAETFVIRVIAGAFFLAGCARVLSWLAVGRPHPFAVALMVIELVLPLVIVPWQRALGKRTWFS